MTSETVQCRAEQYSVEKVSEKFCGGLACLEVSASEHFQLVLRNEIMNYSSLTVQSSHS